MQQLFSSHSICSFYTAYNSTKCALGVCILGFCLCFLGHRSDKMADVTMSVFKRYGTVPVAIAINKMFNQK